MKVYILTKENVREWTCYKNRPDRPHDPASYLNGPSQKKGRGNKTLLYRLYPIQHLVINFHGHLHRDIVATGNMKLKMCDRLFCWYIYIKPPGGGGGGQLAIGSNYAQMCVSKSDGHGSYFSFRGVKWVRIFQSKWAWNLLITQYGSEFMLSIVYRPNELQPT